MRISDWSSDVCSSDLITATSAPPRTGVIFGSAGCIGDNLGAEDEGGVTVAGGTEVPRPARSIRRLERPCRRALVAGSIPSRYGLRMTIGSGGLVSDCFTLGVLTTHTSVGPFGPRHASQHHARDRKSVA